MTTSIDKYIETLYKGATLAEGEVERRTSAIPVTLETIEDTPETAEIPDEAERQLVTVSQLTKHVAEETLEAHLTYVKRLPVKMQVIWGRGVFRGKLMDTLLRSRPVMKWTADIGAML